VITGTTGLNINAAAAPNGLQIIGNSGVNSLTGTAYNDLITGNGGNDVMDGRDGSDVYLVNISTERTAAEINDTGLTGSDELRFAATTAGQTLIVYGADLGLESLVIGTGTGATAITTATTALNVNAAAAANGLSLQGNYGNNTITGSSYADRLMGNRGNDTITGGGGADIFRFDSTLSASTNRDTLTDFNPSEDRIELENAIFSALLLTGPLSAAAFSVGAAATNADQRILYNNLTGTLTYDSNGNAAAGSTVFATLPTGLSALMSAALFSVT
jgi:Ca2+-binding RTX toxin-like protein